MQRIPDQPFLGKDGVRRGWVDVQTHIGRLLGTRFPYVDEDIREEAIASAMLRLLTYWQYLASSSTEDGLTFGHALHYGTRYARTMMHEEIAHRSSRVTGYFHGVSEHAFGDTDDIDVSMDYVVDPDDPFDEVIGGLDETERVRRMLLTLPPEELEDYMRNLLTPLTEREQAQKEGVTQQSIHERREVRKKRATKLARSYGLV